MVSEKPIANSIVRRDALGRIQAAGLILGSGFVTFADQDATPTVAPASTVGQAFKTNNTLATTITNFDDAFDAQRITLVAGDTLTTIEHGTNIFLKGAANQLLALNETIEFLKDGSVWREV